jgi:hypothetical membrane protein
MVGRTSVRALAWAALLGQGLFIVGWLVAGAVEPGYSSSAQTVSDLGGSFARHAWVMNASFVVLGVSMLALGPGLLAVLPRGRAAWMAIGLLALAALAFFLLVPYRLECSLETDARCLTRYHAGQLHWGTYAHVWDSLAARIAVLLTPFAVARALWPRPTGAVALALGVVGVLITVVAALLYGVTSGSSGVIERLELLSLNLWIVILAAGVLHETRPQRPLPAPTPLRPREFFGTKWTGHGQLIVWPWVLSRRLPLTFAVTREQVSVSDELWIVEDRAIFAGGHVESRRMFCELVDPTLIRVTADELPDGTTVHLDERGFRIAPYRAHVRVGPLRIPLRCRDESVVEADGTLMNTVTGHLFGFPVVRLIARARASDLETTDPADSLTAEAARLTPRPR